MVIGLIILSYLTFLFVALPIIKSDFWIFRSLEYTRFQNLIVCFAVVIIWTFVYFYLGEVNLIAVGLNIICVCYLSFKIFPYTILAKKEVFTIKKYEAKLGIKFLNANVLQDNHECKKLLDQILEYKPDVVLLLETDSYWQNQVKLLKKEYPYFLEVPQDNTYGMLLYSKLPFKNEQINFLVKKDIPSINCTLILNKKIEINLWCLHPEPPVPGESLTSTAKDKELCKVALKVKETNIPSIVMGDLNDVAWSYTTSLFTKTSGLLDVRKGRGFYSTFSAHHWFIRFPLDYIFCSPEFGFIAMKRLPFNGSDHFPILTHVVYHPKIASKQQNLEDNSDDIEEATEKANEPIL
jgi:endonuclease/exonuclease/phosphatase (EEP) superfamily protein YafD